MNIVRAYSWRSFFIVLFATSILFALVGGLFWYGLGEASRELTALGQIQNQPDGLKDFIGRMSFYRQTAATYFIPASAVLTVLFTFVLWLFLRIAAAGLFRKARKPAPVETEKRKPTAEVAKDDGKEKKEKAAHDRRMLVYMLSVLQREGRLLDFFSEDLDLYEDDQIGAAVRNIHQSCKKVVDKNLAPRPVIDRVEGEEMTVEPGFDPNEIKLTGNVAGEPPFKGILRHKGWRAEKIEPPTLSSSGDARIIAPAEVEIL